MTAGPMGVPAFVGGIPSGGGGASGSALVIVASEAAASLVPGLAQGQLVEVLSEGSIWFSDPASTIALKANEVIVRAGGGRLIRTEWVNPRWTQSITDVYIDPQNVTGLASNEAQGIYTSVPAVPAPLLTWSELRRRWGRKSTISTGDLVNLTFQIHVLSSIDPAGEDFVDLDFVADTETFPRLLGEANTVLLAGNLDAVGGFTAQNPAVPAPGGTPCSIAVGATVWGPFLGKRIRFTATGAVATILKDLGGGAARISQPQTTNEAFFAILPTNVNPAAGAAFVVEDLALVRMSQDFEFSSVGSALFGATQMNVADVQWIAAPGVPGAGSVDPKIGRANTFLVFYQCVSDAIVPLGSSAIWNGCTARGIVGFPGTNQLGAWFGGATFATGGFGVLVSGTPQNLFAVGQIDFSAYIQDTHVTCRDVTALGALSVWDAVVSAPNPGGHAILIAGVSSERGAGFVSLRGAVPIFGTGSAGVGMRLGADGNVDYTTLPNITGAGGDVLFANSLVAFWFDPATGLYQPPAGIAPTWANIAAPAGPVGFGGQAHLPSQNARIYPASAT